MRLDACPRFLEAAEKFVADNSGFESSAVGEAVRRDLARAPSLHAAALVPLRHKVFGFETSLKWAFFVHTAAGRFFGVDAEEEVPASFRDSTRWPAFEPGRFFGEMVAIYDLAVDAAVWDHCASDSEDEDSEDEEEDDVSGEGSEGPGGGPGGGSRGGATGARPGY